MCVGVTVWFGWGGVVSLCGLKQSFKLNATERRAWKEIENVCRKFRGNDKAENCTEIVQELISPDSVMGCNMSLKVIPFEFFSENIGTFSAELDERFHQVISQIE